MFKHFLGTFILALMIVMLSGCSDNFGGGGGGGGTLTLITTDADGNGFYDATWVGVQDGNGGWTAMTSSGTGQYSANITDANGRYGVAIIYDDGGEAYVRIIQGTLAEMPAIVYPLPGVDAEWAQTVTVSGNLYHSFGSSYGLISIGKASSGTGTQQYNYFLTAEAGNPLDVVGMQTDYQYNPTNIYLDRAFNGAGPTASLNIFFNGEGTFAPDHYTINFPGGWEWQNSTSVLFTTHGTKAMMGENAVLPADQRDPADLYLLQADAGQSHGNWMIYNTAFTNPADVTIPTPPDFAVPTITLDATMPYIRPTITLTPVAAADAYTFYFDQNSPNDVVWDVTVTPGWLGTNDTYTLPDLATGNSDWQSNWEIGLDEDEGDLSVNCTTSLIDTNALVTAVNLFYDYDSGRGYPLPLTDGMQHMMVMNWPDVPNMQAISVRSGPRDSALKCQRDATRHQSLKPVGNGNILDNLYSM